MPRVVMWLAFYLLVETVARAALGLLKPASMMCFNSGRWVASPVTSKPRLQGLGKCKEIVSISIVRARLDVKVQEGYSTVPACRPEWLANPRRGL